jgi:hypothetical protein
MVPTWFLYIGGFSLIILGALQIQQRPHDKGDSLAKRFVNLGTMWSITCIVVGVTLVLMALGWLDWNAAPRPRARHH